MSTICLRGIDETVKERLKHEASQAGISVNALILKFIHKAIGQGATRHRQYHDLDQFAGSWSEEEAAQFLTSISDFEKIDEEMWK